MRKHKPGKRCLHQIGRWVRVPGSSTYTVSGYGKMIPGRYRKSMGGSRLSGAERE